VNRKAIDELKQRIPLLDYLQAHGWHPDRIRFQAGQQPRPAPATSNRRVIVVGCALRNEFPDVACAAEPGFSHSSGCVRRWAVAA
jgi:hypothetical protein